MDQEHRDANAAVALLQGARLVHQIDGETCGYSLPGKCKRCGKLIDAGTCDPNERYTFADDAGISIWSPLSPGGSAVRQIWCDGALPHDLNGWPRAPTAVGT